MLWVPKTPSKKRGFTLLEVTIAIVLIAMILVTSIVAFAGTVDSSFKLRKYGQDAFLDQQAMEERITNAKKSGGEDSYSGVLFGKTVDGYVISEKMDGTTKHLKTFVIPDGSPELRLPIVDGVVNDGKPYMYLGESTGPMRYSFHGPVDDLSLWYTQWFLADSYLMQGGRQVDFSIPKKFAYGDGSTVEEDVYPTYPNHFSQTRIVGDRITAIESYLGRHMVYHVQPVGHYGITGDGNQSSYVYIMGVPVISGLRYHIDMNFFAKTSGYNLALGETENVTKVQDMYNNANASRPVDLSITTYGSGSARSVSKKVLLLDDDKLERNQKLLRLKNAYVGLASMNSISVSMNFYYSGQEGTLFREQAVTSGTDSRWKLIISSDDRVELWLTTANNRPVELVFQSESLEKDTMHNATFVVQSGQDIRLTVDGADATQLIPNYKTYSANRAKWIGGTGEIELTEVVIYTRALSSTEFSKVEKYMLDKNRSNH